MNQFQLRNRGQRLALVSMMVVSQGLMACGGGSSTPNTSNLPSIDESAGSGGRQTASAPAEKKGMSTGKKIALLAGAAAVYYMYKKNQTERAKGNTTEPQYYLSKNGRVYYREAGGRVHWVTAPKEGIAVPADEAQAYSEFEGFDGRSSGRSLAGIGTDQ
ncbi:MAG: hypothetical protein IAF58_11015 [Leptolyngbya sp.]|nr:hypothetical protein [Candidatus Melainabacteria bacterium]